MLGYLTILEPQDDNQVFWMSRVKIKDYNLRGEKWGIKLVQALGTSKEFKVILSEQGPWIAITVLRSSVKFLCRRMKRGEIYSMDENFSILVPHQPILCWSFLSFVSFMLREELQRNLTLVVATILHSSLQNKEKPHVSIGYIIFT